METVLGGVAKNFLKYVFGDNPNKIELNKKKFGGGAKKFTSLLCFFGANRCNFLIFPSKMLLVRLNNFILTILQNNYDNRRITKEAHL